MQENVTCFKVKYSTWRRVDIKVSDDSNTKVKKDSRKLGYKLQQKNQTHNKLKEMVFKYLIIIQYVIFC